MHLFKDAISPCEELKVTKSGYCDSLSLKNVYTSLRIFRIDTQMKSYLIFNI